MAAQIRTQNFPPIDYGGMDQEITLQSPVRVPDSYGRLHTTWVNQARVRAQVATPFTWESAAGVGITRVIRMHFYPGVLHSWRIVWHDTASGIDRFLNIKGDPQPSPRVDELRITAEEGEA